MPAEVEPAELAQLIDFAERPHTENWSLARRWSATRHRNLERVNDLLALVRRIQRELDAQSTTLQRDGEEIWAALEHDTRSPDIAPLVELLDAAKEIDRLGDALAAWAVDISARVPTTRSTLSSAMSRVAWIGSASRETNASLRGSHAV